MCTVMRPDQFVFLFSTLLDGFYVFFLKYSFEASTINMKLLSINLKQYIYMKWV